MDAAAAGAGAAAGACQGALTQKPQPLPQHD